MGRKLALRCVMKKQRKERKIKMEDMKFCQSCGMPLTKTEDFGTEKDGKLSEDYCVYCYKDGAFTADCTMEEMIDFCAAPMVASNPGMEEEEAKKQMRQFFPQLKRWR
jgi:hypothetical protein